MVNRTKTLGRIDYPYMRRSLVGCSHSGRAGLEANAAARARIITQERCGGLTRFVPWLVRLYQVTLSRVAVIRLPNAMLQTLRY